MKHLHYSVFTVAALLCLSSCDNSPANDVIETNGKPLTPIAKSIPSYFNADTLRVYYSSSPLNYYFVDPDNQQLYSTYKGYESKEIAEGSNERRTKSKEIEIQFNPETKEIYRAYLHIHDNKTIYPKLTDLKYAMQFVAVVSPAASGQFERNFSRIFSDYLNDTPIDSNKFRDESKNLAIEIQNDFDLVAKKEEDVSSAFIEISILNLENLRKMK